MISIAIIAIVLIAVYKLQSQTLLMGQEAEFYAKAPFLASAKGTEITSASPGMPQSGSGDFGENHPGYSWRVDITDVVSDALGEVADDIKQVDITVLFNAGERKYTLRTYRFIR
jgi:general secretion pathway protein I